MSGLRSAIEQFLGDTGRLEIPLLGKKGAPRPARPDSNSRFAKKLAENLKRTNRLVIVATVMICILFLLGLVVTVWSRGPTAIVVSADGAFLASQLGVIRFLRRLWLEKSLMHFLEYLCNRLPPEDLAEILKPFYFSTFIRAPDASKSAQTAAKD